MLLTLGVALGLVLPYALARYRGGFSLPAIYRSEIIAADHSHGYFGGAAVGLYEIARVSLYYLGPLALTLLVLSPRGRRAAVPLAGEGSDTQRLLARFSLMQFAALVAGVFIGGMTRVKLWWFLSVFFLFPLYALVRFAPAGLDARRTRLFAAVLLAAEAAIVLAIVVNVLRGDRLGRPSWLNAPYDAVAERLANAGFTRGTIVAGRGPLAGNLRVRFPGSRVVRLANPDYVPPATTDGQCLIVWEQGPDSTTPADLGAWIASALHIRSIDAPVRVVEAKYRWSRTHALRVYFVLLPEGRGRCR